MGTATLFLQDETQASELTSLVLHTVEADENLVLRERANFERIPLFGTLIDAAGSVTLLWQHARGIDASRIVQLANDLLLRTGHRKPHVLMVRALGPEVGHLCMNDLTTLLIHL